MGRVGQGFGMMGIRVGGRWMCGRVCGGVPGWVGPAVDGRRSGSAAAVEALGV